MRPRRLAALMFACVLLVAALALWDNERESSVALEDFGSEQARLATVVAADLAARGVASTGSLVCASLRTLLPAGEGPGPRTLRFFLTEGDGALWSRGGPLSAPGPLRGPFPSQRRWVRLLRPEAASLGLPARMALVGLAPLPAAQGSRCTVVVAASAARLRDRERRARWRLGLGVFTVAAVAAGFGLAALRMQRKELHFASALQRARLERERDAQLAREDRAATMLTMAAGMAHEVATPLGVIAGRAEQLLERVPAEDARGRRSARAILEQVERVRAVVRGMLELARGRPPSFERVEPSALLRSAVALVEHRFAGSGVELRAEDASGEGALRGDAQLLEQALVNLLLNALDACEEGGCVELSAERDGEHWLFAVTDDGAGLSPEAAARAAEPFFSTKAREQGTGLGLAVTREILALHRGSFELSPRAPRGTTARLRVPAATEDHVQR